VASLSNVARTAAGAHAGDVLVKTSQDRFLFVRGPRRDRRRPQPQEHKPYAVPRPRTSALVLRVRVGNRVTSSAAAFLHVDDELRLVGLFRQLANLPAQFLVFLRQGWRSDRGPRLCGFRASRTPARRSRRQVTKCVEYTLATKKRHLYRLEWPPRCPPLAGCAAYTPSECAVDLGPRDPGETPTPQRQPNA
jgi:hypothetical protein